jgi:hypothetical protein
MAKDVEHFFSHVFIGHLHFFILFLTIEIILAEIYIDFTEHQATSRKYKEVLRNTPLA